MIWELLLLLLLLLSLLTFFLPSRKERVLSLAFANNKELREFLQLYPFIWLQKRFWILCLKSVSNYYKPFNYRVFFAPSGFPYLISTFLIPEYRWYSFEIVGWLEAKSWIGYPKSQMQVVLRISTPASKQIVNKIILRTLVLWFWRYIGKWP